MPRSHADELQVRSAIRARLQMTEPGAWSLLHRQFIQIPERTFYNWVRQERARASVATPPLPAPKAMATVQRLLSGAALKLGVVSTYQQVWDDCELLRHEAYAAPGGLNAPLLRRSIKSALSLIKPAVDICDELLAHNRLDLVVEAMIPVLQAMERSQGEVLAKALGLHLERVKEAGSRAYAAPSEPDAEPSLRSFPTLAAALCEVGLRGLVHQLMAIASRYAPVPRR